jgi:prepilin-type N-terminal cleavage/methylation domain-containing protein
MKIRSQSAFTLIEMLVVISIIAVLAAFAVPALTSALTKGQMTGTLNNGRQLYLAGQQMALDGSANSDPTLVWPGDDAALTTMSAYATRLVRNDYLKVGDLTKLLSAPGAGCTASSDNATPPTITLAAVQNNTRGAFKVYRVRDADAANVVFCVTSNYDYNANFPNATAVPFGDKGFIVQRKGGDASILRKNNANVAANGGNANAFSALVGLPTGSTDPANPPAGDPANSVLTFP